MMQRFPRSKLFVGGLSHDTTDGSLLAYFEQFGNVASAEVLRDHQTLNSRGFGFVTFVEEYVAQKVIKIGFASPHVVDGKQVEVKMAVPKELKQMEEAALHNSHSHNRNYSVASFNSLPSDRAFVNDIYQPAQRSRSVSAAKYQSINDPDYGGGSLFHVPMLTPENSKMRFKERSPTSVSSYSSTSIYSMSSPLQRVCSMPAMRYPNAPPLQGRVGSNLVANKIFVGGLLYATGHESLRAYFNRFGEIESAEVIYNRETKKSRGFGFVIFKHHESLKKVLCHQQTESLMVDGKQIEIKLCKPREECIYEQGLGLTHNPDISMEGEIYTMRRHSFEEYKKDADYATDLFGEFNQLGLDEINYEMHDNDTFLSPFSKLRSTSGYAGDQPYFPLSSTHGGSVDRENLLLPKARGYYDQLSDKRRFEAFSPKYDSSERLPCIFESEINS